MKDKSDVLTYTETKVVETKITSINLGQAIDLATSITIQLRTHGEEADYDGTQTVEDFSITKKAALEGFALGTDGHDLTTISGVIHTFKIGGFVDFVHPTTNVSIAKLYVDDDSRLLVIDGNG